MQIIKIGRLPHNDVVIDDGYVSGSHCQIIKGDNGEYTLIDSNSTNGTYINGVRRHGEVRLSPSDIVQVGHTTLPWQNYFNTVGVYDRQQSPNQNKPNNHIAIAIVCLLIFSLIMGIVSLVFALKVDKLWESGDTAGAQEASQKALTCFWIGLGLWAVKTIVFIVLNV